VAPRPYLSFSCCGCVCVRANKINIERAHAANKRTAAAALRVYGAPRQHCKVGNRRYTHAAAAGRTARVQQGKRFFCRRFCPPSTRGRFRSAAFLRSSPPCAGAHSNCLTIDDFHVWRTCRIPLTKQLFVINIDLRNLHAHSIKETAD
jgi:hypothetical protein